MSVLNEVGVYNVDITFLPEIVIRLSSFIRRQKDLVDVRWITGNWENETGLSETEQYIQQIKPFDTSIDIVSIGK